MATASTYSTVNIEGAGATILSAVDTDIHTINASTMTGTLTMTGRTSTAINTITGGTEADTLIMRNSGDIMDGTSNTSASATDADTLDINFAAVLGGIEVNLANTGDQVTTFNGSANAASQTNFTSVDVSGYTGSFGAQITANALGSTVTGTLNADVVTLGAAADVVEINDSTADTINSFTLGTDALHISISALEAVGDTGIDAAAVDFNEIHDANASAAGDTITVTELVSGADTAVGDAANMFVLLTDTFATTALVETAIEDAGTHEMVITANTVADNDAFFIVYSDGTNAYLAAVHATAAQNTVAFETGETTVVNVATLAGVTSIAAGDILASNFEFIA
jgi:hypothetical protein